MGRRTKHFRTLTTAAVTLMASPLMAAPARENPVATASSPAARAPTRAEVEAFLDSRALPKTGSFADRPVPREEVPPPPPRKRGLVVEGTMGALFQLGALRHVSPTSPWFQLLVGYEFTDWFLLAAQGDFTIADTSFASQPPPPRTYAEYAVSGAPRFQLTIVDPISAYVQFELGVASATEDVLQVYGYRDADELSLFYGGRLGLEWFMKNPHLALALSGTVRNMPGLERNNSADAPLVIIGAGTLRYAF